jgi:hypothetical protein
VSHAPLPDLRGRWLVLFDLQTGDRHRVVPSFVELEGDANELDVVEHFVRLPDAMNAELDAATESGTAWHPTAAQLREIDRLWTELPDAERGVYKVSAEIWGKDAFDDTIRKEADLTGATWVLRQTYYFAPGEARPVRQVNVYGGMTAEGDTWRGNTVTTMVAMTPFPVPITVKGPFQMIRIGDPTPRGLLARILGAFKGCGR